MAIIISMISGKGGVGKTCISQNIAHTVAAYGGKNVLVVDCDLSTAGATQFVQLSHKLSANDNLVDFVSILNNPDKYIERITRHITNEQENNSNVISVEIGSSDEADIFGAVSIDRAKGNFHFIPAKSIVPELRGFRVISFEYDEMRSSLCEIIDVWEMAYDLIIFDLGAGYNEGNRLHELIADLSERIMLVREDDNLSLQTTRDLYKKLMRKFSEKQIFHCITKIENKYSETSSLWETKADKYKVFAQNSLTPLCLCFSNSNNLKTLLTSGKYITSKNFPLFIELWHIIDIVLPDLKCSKESYHEQVLLYRKNEMQESYEQNIDSLNSDQKWSFFFSFFSLPYYLQY